MKTKTLVLFELACYVRKTRQTLGYFFTHSVAKNEAYKVSGITGLECEIVPGLQFEVHFDSDSSGLVHRVRYLLNGVHDVSDKVYSIPPENVQHYF